MAREKKTYPDDDGRTVADMSGIERQPLVLPRLKKRGQPEQDGTDDASRPEVPLTEQERRSYVFGALGAALLIAAVFVIVFAVAIVLLLTFWK